MMGMISDENVDLIKEGRTLKVVYLVKYNTFVNFINRQ